MGSINPDCPPFLPLRRIKGDKTGLIGLLFHPASYVMDSFKKNGRKETFQPNP